MSAQRKILARYGHPNAQYQAVYCELWKVSERFPWFPTDRIFINKDFRKKLEAAFANLERVGLQGEIKTYDGCFNERKVRDSDDATSLHAWGMAIDLNASTEKRGRKDTDWSGRFIAIMTAQGLFWGGHFHTVPDNMHWALYDG